MNYVCFSDALVLLFFVCFYSTQRSTAEKETSKQMARSVTFLLITLSKVSNTASCCHLYNTFSEAFLNSSDPRSQKHLTSGNMVS